MLKRCLSLLLMMTALAAFAGCTLGPDFKTPPAAVPAEYKDAGSWRPADPWENLPRSAWWEIYNDPILNDLEMRVTSSNQELQAGLSRVAQARASARISLADLYPRLDVNGVASRGRTAGDFSPDGRGQTSNFISLPLDLAYEVDLWGRIRRSVEAAGAEADAFLADYHGLLLTIQAEVARLYFGLRTFDEEIAVVRRTIGLREENLQLVTSRFRGGEISKLDVNRAETELATAQADAVGLQRRRTEFENALAVLVGLPASEFSLTPQSMDLQPPVIAAGLPAALLQRRPDIARSQRLVAAANARIGIAETAFFPAVSLFGSGGFESRGLSSLFDANNRVWALGPAVSLPIFEGGRNRANLNRARAAWEETVANYRQQTLVAFQEVEDGLAGLRLLAEQAVFLDEAVRAARRAAELSGKRYDAGMVSYLEVVDAERTTLQSERLAIQLLGARLQTSVFLIRALGGGFDLEASLASE